MFCPKCGCDNKDSAKFCKKCGTSLSKVSNTKKEFLDSHKKTGSDSKVNDVLDVSNNSKSSKNLIIVCLTVIICTALIVGSVLYVSYNNGTNDNSNINSSVNVNDNSAKEIDNNSEDSATDNTETVTTTKANDDIYKIDWVEFFLDGNPNTGADATIYVGPEYSGEEVEVSMSYSRNGNYFECEGYHWYTVNDDGTIFVRTTAALNKYPDTCEISLIHNGKTITATCPMKKHKGTQRTTL